MIPPSTLRDVLDYDPRTGYLVWRTRPGNEVFNGRYAGRRALIRRSAGGYLTGMVLGQAVLAHRAIFALVHGRWPRGQIDHINGNRADNRIVNLRDVDETTNRMNQCRRSDNTTGVTGVFFSQNKRRWIAHICVRGQRRQIGSFASRDEAVAARLQQQRSLGFGPNHGAVRMRDHP